MVMETLTPMEVANFRFLCKSVSEVGKRFLVPKIHLLLSKESFDQMQAITNDPDISRGVKEIFYEAR